VRIGVADKPNGSVEALQSCSDGFPERAQRDLGALETDVFSAGVAPVPVAVAATLGVHDQTRQPPGVTSNSVLDDRGRGGDHVGMLGSDLLGAFAERNGKPPARSRRTQR
jgi:hypothetical protein